MLIGFVLVLPSLFTPAVFGFVSNLIRPTMTSWVSALFSSAVFFVLYFLIFILLQINIYSIPTEMPP